LSAEPVWIVVVRLLPLFSQRCVEMAELGVWPWIVYQQATAIRQLFDETFAAAGMLAPVGMVETPSIFLTLELLQTSDMIAPRFIASSSPRALPRGIPLLNSPKIRLRSEQTRVLSAITSRTLQRDSAVRTPHSRSIQATVQGLE